MIHLWTEIWAGFSIHMFGTKFYRHTNTSPQINPPSPLPLTPALCWTPPHTHWSEWEAHSFFFSLVSIPSRGASVPTLLLPTYPHTYSSPTPIQTAPSFLSTYIYLISITFSLGPDEVATVWWLQRLVCDLHVLIALFQQSRRNFNKGFYVGFNKNFMNFNGCMGWLLNRG